MPAFWRESIAFYFRKRGRGGIGNGEDGRAKNCESGANFDRGAGRDEVPDFVDFRVGNGDAAEGPVIEAVRGTEPALPVGKTVDHDGSAGRDAEFCGTLVVFGIGIRNVEEPCGRHWRRYGNR